MTHQEAVKHVVGQVEYHGIYTAAFIQQLFDDAGIKVRVGTSWKVTKSFIKSVERSGGWCNMKEGTSIVDGRGVAYLLMQFFQLKNEESYIGNGKQFYSDMELIFAEAKRRDEAGVTLTPLAPQKAKRAKRSTVATA